jgi:hypothetical protein
VAFCPFCGTAQNEKPQAAPARPVEVPIFTPDVVAEVPVPTPVSAPPNPTPADVPVVAERNEAATEKIAPPDVRANPPAKKGWGRYVLAGVVAVVLLRIFWPSADTGCESAISASTESASQGSLDTAKGKALEAIAACKGDNQQRAKAMFASLEARIASANVCASSSQEYKTALGDGRLLDVARLMDTTLKGCEAPAALAARKTELETAQRMANNTAAVVQEKLQLGDTAAARETLEQLKKLNRDHPKIAAFQTSIDAEETKARAAAAAAAEEAAAAARPEPTPNQAQAPTPAPPAQVRAPDVAEQMAAAMLRDGEAALAQKRYSEAKALASSLLRQVPSPQARDLLRRATDAEARALRDDTTLR